MQHATLSPPDTFVQRRRRLRERMARVGLERAVIASGLPQPRNFAHNLYPFRASSHFLYFVGEPLEAAVLVVEPERETLYLDPPDPNASLWTGREPGPDELADRLKLEVLPLDELQPGADAACTPPPDALTTWWLSDLLDRPLEPAHGAPQSEPDARLAAALIEIRLQHDAAAIEQLRQAAAVTLRAHEAAMRTLRRCGTEYEVLAVMEAEIRRAGMLAAYQPIVTCHGEVLHNESYANELAPGDLLLADVGAETREGWAADVTRTWPVSGRFSPTQRDVYEVVLEAQRAAIAQVRPGVRYRDVHLSALGVVTRGLSDLGILRGSEEQLIRAGAAAAFFPHGVGHLLGLDVHDMEDLGDAAGYQPGRQRDDSPATRYLRLDRDLSPGMVVTIEPGFYQVAGLLDVARADAELAGLIDFERLAQFRDVRGIRIEDDVLVTDHGCEVLTEGLAKTVRDVEGACQQ
ncbi:MAG TPA: aminopeptidase P family protein [Polyangiaceae bacterium]|nr:aminopeptidase P family protein [Polyangiaceae bacterium]